MPLKIGAHLSIEGGIHRAIERGKELGCNTIQIFLRNRNRWKGRDIGEEESKNFKEYAQKWEILPLIAHAIYLINLSSPDSTIFRKSLEVLHEDIKKCKDLNIQYFIVHPGFHLGSGEKEGIRRFVLALREILHEAEVEILIENSAGGGTQIGWNFEQIEKIVNLAKGKLGLCIDTCHLFSAGYPINHENGFEKTVAEIERRIGLEKIKVIHLNDSKRELGSKIDRHEHIGLGKIGMDGFRFFLHFHAFKFLPFIIETPRGKDRKGVDMDLVNMRRLKSIWEESELF